MGIYLLLFQCCANPMYIKFLLMHYYVTFVIILTFIQQRLLVYAQIENTTIDYCGTFDRIEPRDFLSQGDKIQFYFTDLNENNLTIPSIIIYEYASDAIIECIHEQANLTSDGCTTKRSTNWSIAYNSSAEFGFFGFCKLESGQENHFGIQLENYVTIVDPSIEYSFPTSIFLDHQTLIEVKFKEIHPRHLNGPFDIRPVGMECGAITVIPRGARTYCNLTGSQSSGQVYYSLVTNTVNATLVERWLNVSKRPILNNIEPIFVGSCHPFHITGQNLNSFERLQVSLETSNQTVENCKILNDALIQCPYKNSLPPQTAIEFDKVHFTTHGSLLTNSELVYIPFKPVPIVKSVTYKYGTKMLTVHLENFETLYEELTTIEIVDSKDNTSIKCLKPYTFGEKKSTVECKVEQQLSNSDNHEALINISCKVSKIHANKLDSYQYFYKLWVEIMIIAILLIIVFLTLCYLRRYARCYIGSSTSALQTSFVTSSGNFSKNSENSKPSRSRTFRVIRNILSSFTQAKKRRKKSTTVYTKSSSKAVSWDSKVVGYGNRTYNRNYRIQESKD